MAKSTGGSYDPSKKSIGELLAVTSPKIIVPQWQRSYSWTVSHVETFWNDLVNFMESKNRQEYFMGSVVIVKTTTDEHLLLDGQQRLATATILLSVIRDFARKYNKDAAQRIQARYLADFDDATEATTYKLTLNRYDGDFFRRFISVDDSESKAKPPKPTHASHRLIAKAQKFFEGVFEEKYAELEPQAAFKWALTVQKHLTDQLTLIAITSTDEDSAAEVFETLNDRGIGLSTPDLLRNLIMRRANPKNQDEIVAMWGPILSFEKDQIIKNFIRHFWVSKYGDVKSQALYREIKDNIIDNDISSLEFSIDLRNAAENYRSILEGTSESQECADLLNTIQSLGSGARILYPSLLAVLDSLEGDQQTTVIRALINTYVRHSVIGQRENSRLENVIYRATREFRVDGDVKKFIGKVTSAAPNDETFSQDFATASLTDSRVQRYILEQIEMHIRETEELDVASASRVHVEHIYPQTPEAQYRVPNHADIVNRIGNLTLLSAKLNTSLKNAPYKDKRPVLQQSNLEITRRLSSFEGKPPPETWSENLINLRQNALAEMAPLIWPSEQKV